MDSLVRAFEEPRMEKCRNISGFYEPPNCRISCRCTGNRKSTDAKALRQFRSKRPNDFKRRGTNASIAETSSPVLQGSTRIRTCAEARLRIDGRNKNA